METAQARTVGVLGAGRMGLPVIGHLVRAGFPVVVHDTDPGKRPTVTGKGAEFTKDPGDLADRCETVLACVGYEEQLAEVMLGEGQSNGGMLRRRPAGSLVAVLSTVSPAFMRRLDAAAAPHGVDVVDAPVCRGSWAADAGQLLSLVGGTEAAAARFTPVARAYSSDVVRLGDVGAGQVGKAVNNLILWACLVADHEGLALAHRFGVDTDQLRGPADEQRGQPRARQLGQPDDGLGRGRHADRAGHGRRGRHRPAAGRAQPRGLPGPQAPPLPARRLRPLNGGGPNAGGPGDTTAATGEVGAPATAVGQPG